MEFLCSRKEFGQGYSRDKLWSPQSGRCVEDGVRQSNWNRKTGQESCISPGRGRERELLNPWPGAGGETVYEQNQLRELALPSMPSPLYCLVSFYFPLSSLQQTPRSCDQKVCVRIPIFIFEGKAIWF